MEVSEYLVEELVSSCWVNIGSRECTVYAGAGEVNEKGWSKTGNL